jgi:hypothetical protein
MVGSVGSGLLLGEEKLPQQFFPLMFKIRPRNVYLKLKRLLMVAS